MAFDLGELFGVDESTGLQQISVDKLVPYHEHPFELYTGERLEDMIQSVKENGIICPIIAQPIGDGEYEILAGHNRWNAAKLAKLKEVPVIVKEGLSAEEAEKCVIESNVMQRGFDNLKISEQAEVISKRQKQITKYRKNQITDELLELEGYDTSAISSNQTLEELGLGIREYNALKRENCHTVGDVIINHARLKRVCKSATAAFDNTLHLTKSGKKKADGKTRDVVGIEYGLSGKSVARLLRVAELPDELKPYVDNGSISIRAAVQLSYISTSDMQRVLRWLDSLGDYRISEQKAKDLREASENYSDDYTFMEIIGIKPVFGSQDESDESSASEPASEAAPKPKKKKVAVSADIYEKLKGYDDIDAVVEAALAMYFKSIK